MHPSEQKSLAARPKRVKVFRGFTVEGGEAGWSWHVSHRGAGSFARFYRVLFGGNCECRAHGYLRAAHAIGESPRLATGIVKREDIIAYLRLDREGEMLIPPAAVEVVGVRMLDQPNARSMTEGLSCAQARARAWAQAKELARAA